MGDMKESGWIYYGMFLDDEGKKNLLNEFCDLIPDGWRTYCDHMTIIYNNHTEDAERWADICEKEIGKRCVLNISAVGVSERAIAIRVYGYPSSNKNPHITIAVAPDAKPVESNDIVDWLPYDGGLSVSAELRCVRKKQ